MDSLIHPIFNQRYKSDVIVIIGGDEGRLEKGIELYKQGYAPKILLSPISMKKGGLTVKKAELLGVKKGDIITENKSTSTYNTVFNVCKVMDYFKYRKAIIVTSDYHMKRTIMVFKNVDKKKYNFYFVSSLYKNEFRWYNRPNSIFIWYNEFKKIIGYRLKLYKFIDL
ncbi:YdcF family protein [Macrococcoides caseolyticum]|uniref:YdcF family protein n=1 Tax=Macrococcoides caseolyticum TaxID=69966 RepID=UPI001F3263F6|nr:YdcF family protein [Macrococcus caseolyticus]MCE4955666.1 YdcF family protein [Macrococcus caseolyticus]